MKAVSDLLEALSKAKERSAASKLVQLPGRDDRRRRRLKRWSESGRQCDTVYKGGGYSDRNGKWVLWIEAQAVCGKAGTVSTFGGGDQNAATVTTDGGDGRCNSVREMHIVLHSAGGYRHQ
ncbi:hypothetical protein PIB30_085661 [Stylosanthes scabra]|uniref:Uncharacterized protein n=1 Tax=Stylosanthes scabra TaxID=79078 RepID=A0ABU6URS8_9FABA|nr:hypothetical protein [Stylosanthes scabra]